MFSPQGSTQVYYVPINVNPLDGGGGELAYKTVPWVGSLNIHGAPVTCLTFREQVTLGAEI